MICYKSIPIFYALHAFYASGISFGLISTVSAINLPFKSKDISNISAKLNHLKT
jgi:hypothetical protein